MAQPLAQSFLVPGERSLRTVVVEIRCLDVAVLLIVDDARVNGVERHKVGDLVAFGILGNVGPHHLFLVFLCLLEEQVLDFVLGETLCEHEPRLVPVQEVMDGLDILGLHWSETWGRRVAWEMVPRDLSCLCRSSRESRKSNVI